jgi:DNA-binding response OmpR family regulator
MAYIVLVEDNEDVADLMCHALRAEGHRCFVIRSKAGAERFFRRVRPDLVVLDCLLIGGDGLQLAQQLASEAHVPVIVTSGDTERAERAIQAGLLCFKKPFRLSDLAVAVSNLLAESGAAESSNWARQSRFRPYRARGGGYGSPG